MADNALAKAGLYFDELNKVRLLRPPVAHDAADLRDESRTFISQIDQFESSNEALMQAMTQLAKLVDQEKLRAIASRNAINNLDKIRQNQNQQLQILIRERQVELERLRIEHESLRREENDQRDYLQQFLAPI